MRATVMYGAGDVRVENVPDARIVEPTDALLTVTRACICGSDLWPYQQMAPSAVGNRMGHEFIGVVEDVGRDVRTLKKGDVVIAPFAISDGTCEFCHEGLQTSCIDGAWWGGKSNDGGQGEAVRVPHADDAVGLCGVIAAKRLGAERIIMLGRHADRIALAREFGATDAVSERGDAAVARVRELTGGFGAHAVLESVGHVESMETALRIARPGGAVGRVGVPQSETIPAAKRTFYDNITIAGGPAPARAYIETLLPDVLEMRIQPGRVFDRVTDLVGVPDGYRAMSDREAIKVMITF